MKTPSFLLLAAALASASPASAAREPHQRCDTEFLERTASVFGEGGVYREQRIQIQNVLKPGGGTIEKMRLSHLNENVVCDATVDWHIRKRSSSGVRNPKVMGILDTADAGGQARILLVIDDFYKDFDAKALAAVAAADAALDAAAKLGLVESPKEPAAGAKSMSELIPVSNADSRPATGGAIGAHVPRAVTLLEPGKQNRADLPVEEVGAAFRELLGGGGLPGNAVLAFRQAVLGLGMELEKHGKSDALVKKRLGLAVEGIKDFTPGLGSFKALPATKENLTNAEKYKAGLHALVGASAVPDIGDRTERQDAMLDAVDVGLRNLIAIRSDQLDKIMELAKGRLGGKSVSQYETSLRLAAERTSRKVGENTLAAATLEALAGDKDYQDLDRLYHDALRRAGGDASKLEPGEKAAGEALQRIQAAAATAVTKTGDKAEISYTMDGKADGRRVTMPSVVPADVESDERTRRDVAGEIARDIVAGNLGDAKPAAALAALRGREPQADPVPEGVKPPVAADRPPKPRTAWDALADSSDAGCGMNPANLMRGKAERAALRQAERAAEDATEMSEARRRLQDELRGELQTINDACDREIADIRAKPRSARLTEEAKAAQIQEEVNAAEARCNGRLEAKEKEFAPRIEAVKRETQDANAQAALVRAEGERAKWYEEGVPQALDELLEDYTKGDRRAALVARTFDDEMVNDDVARFFRDLPPSFKTDCAKALGYDADPAKGRFSDPAKLKDPVPGEVEKNCRASVSVHKDKVAGVKAACKAEYAAAADGADKQLLTAPLKDALCAAIAAKMGSRGTSGSAPAPVERRRTTIPGGE